MLDNEYNITDSELATLARMANMRGKTSCPDPSAAWKRFKATEMQKSKPNRHMYVWVAFAAAACLLAFALIMPWDKLGRKDVYVPVAVAQQGTKPAAQATVSSLHHSGVTNVQTAQNTSAQTVTTEPAKTQETVIAKDEPKLRKVATPRGMNVKVTLPDGSEVWLNAESSIEFPTAFIGGERNVSLKGEAYFKVAHDENSPFYVNCANMSVKVLGTEFNFRNYRDETAHVSLVRGSVEVMQGDMRQGDIRLQPGQDAWLDNSGTIHVNNIDTYGVTQWVKGFFYFENAPLIDILKEMGRWYNMGIVFRNPANMHKKMHFSASRNEDAQTTIDGLNSLHKAKVRIEDNNFVVY